jgi:hypothetical protein
MFILEAHSEVLIFLLYVYPWCSDYSALLPTTPKIFQRFFPQPRKMISVATTPIIFLRFCLQRGKVP